MMSAKYFDELLLVVTSSHSWPLVCTFIHHRDLSVPIHLFPTAVMVRSFGFNPLQSILSIIFKEAQSIYHISKPITRRHFQKIVLILFLQITRFEQLRQGELSFSFAEVNCSTQQQFLRLFSFSHANNAIDIFLSLCYERIGSCF